MARKAGLELQREWRRRLGRFSGSKLSVAEFCHREGVSAPSFYGWRKKLAAARDGGTTAGKTPSTAKAAFLPVQVAASGGVQVTFPNGAALTLAVDDPELIKRLIEAVAQTPTASGEA